MNQKQAKPGDIIEYIGPVSSFRDMRYLVVEFPGLPFKYNNTSYTWGIEEDEKIRGGTVFFRSPEDYIIIDSNSSPSPISCQDCHGTGEIMLLTSTVKCRCRK